jgi:ribose/xylose/arabinose/galactoside ABC-type transport system permease subunit
VTLIDERAEIDKSIALRGTLSWIWTVFGPFVGLVLITGLFAWLTRDSGNFMSLASWRTIAVQTVVVGIAALGMTAIMISGGIDLSVGSTVALVTVSIALFVRTLQPKLPVGLREAQLLLPLAMLLGILLGGLCGAINGLLISGLRVVPFIVTLGSYKIYRGLAKWLASNGSIYVPEDAKPWWFSRVLALEPASRWQLVAPGVWILAVLSIVLAVTLRYTVLGRYVYAIGSNEATARICGIRVPRVKIIVYTLGGLATGLAGVLQLLFLNGTGDPTTADGLELRVIAAVVIGGGSLSGGEGTVLGTLIGCLIMSVLNNGCTHAGIPNASQDIIIGIIIVVAVAIDQLRRRAG